MINEVLISNNCPCCGSPQIFWDEKEHSFKCEHCKSILSRKVTEVLLTNYRICERCGSPNEQENKFCLQCSLPLLQKCPNCGRYIAVNAKYCHECNVEIESTKVIKSNEQLKKSMTNFEIKKNNLENEIKNVQNEITNLQNKIKVIIKASRRLYLFGSLFLSEENKWLYHELGNDSPPFLVNVIFRLTTMLILAMGIEKSINENVENYIWLFNILGSDGLTKFIIIFSFAFIHLIIALLNLVVRMGNAEKLIPKYERDLSFVKNKETNLLREKNKIEELLGDAKEQYSKFSERNKKFFFCDLRFFLKKVKTI